MASSVSSKKRIRQTAARRERNRSYRSAIRTEIKKFDEAVVAEDATKAGERLKYVSRKLDKLVSKGIVHKNQAARRKSRMSVKLQSLSGEKS